MPLASAEPIEWSVKEGDTYTWVVRQTNEGLGFLPVGSKYEMTIDTIRIWDSSGGEQQTELYVNLTSYNSDTEVTTTILNNQTLVYFDAATNTTTFFPIIDHTGFCIPKTNIDGCVEGIKDFLDSVYDFEVTLHLQEGMIMV